MALIAADRVKETTTTTGTGSITLAGAATGYQTFSAVCANNDTTYYCIAGQSSAEWEVGLGTWTTGGNLARTTIIASSNSGSAVSFSAGTKDVFLTLPAQLSVLGIISPGSLSADQNNYAPTGISTANVVRLTSSVNIAITGLTGGVDGRRIIVLNIGTKVVSLPQESASSTAANRFTAPQDVSIRAGGFATFIYDGGTSRWVCASKAGVNAYKTVADANYTILATDMLVALTTLTATRTLTLPAANLVSPGQEYAINDGSGSCTDAITISIAAAGSDTIDGATTTNITSPYGCARLFSDGVSKWWRYRGSPNVQAFTGSGTWTKPPWAATCFVTTIAGGGGGAGGGYVGVTSVGIVSNSGGAGGGYSQAVLDAQNLGPTQTITVGAGGTGGAGASGVLGNSATAGSVGVAGGNTSFGTVVGAQGGGGGPVSGGGNSTAGTGQFNGVAGTTTSPNAGTGGPGGGGGGGYVSPNNAVNGGYTGGPGPSLCTRVAGGAGGTASTSPTAGTAGPSQPTNAALPGAGGGGGGGLQGIGGAGGTAGAGGAGGNYGAGGGGGGAVYISSAGTYTGGVGGAGGPGICVVVSW